MRKAQVLLSLLFILQTFALSALDGLRFEDITNRDGLSHNTIRYVMQDSRGFMWFSTVNGLDCYDGHQFVSLRPGFEANSLTENNIRRTTEDKNGRIWVQTTSRFMHCYDTHIETFVDYLGNNEARKYRRVEVLPNGDVWLWGNEQGACRIRYENNVLSSTLYDINTIGTNVVYFVLEDDSKQIWIGTNKGLIQQTNGVPKFCNTEGITYSFHSAVEQEDKIVFFTNSGDIIAYDKQLKYFLPTLDFRKWKGFKLNNVASLDEHTILITGRQLMLLLDTRTLELSDARHLFDGELLTNTHILRNNVNGLWVQNETGCLWNYKPEQERFLKHCLIPQGILSLIDSERFDICRDSRGITWITTYGNGLFAIDTAGELHHFTQENSNLKTNYLLTVYEDRMSNIWIGTENIGLVKIFLPQYNYQQFFPNPDKSDAANRIIRSVYEDKQTKELWLGTKQGDVYILDENLKQKEKLALRQGVPYCMLQDTSGNMWIGTKGNGLAIIPPGQKSNKEVKFHHLSTARNTGAGNIYALLRDNKNRIWVGTLGGGLFLCEWRDNTLHTTEFPALSDKQDQVRCMIQDSSGLIWVGGSNGIVTFDPDTLLKERTQFQWHHFDKNNKQSLNNNIIKAIYEDSQQRVWVGTSGGGVNLAEKSELGEMVFKHYTLADGLINDMIQALLEDKDGKLWISTENGISKFDPENLHFENYSFHDNWESDLFCESAACKRSNGELLFGSHNGLYIFNPALMEVQTASPAVTLTRLLINGVPVTLNTTDSPLKESITQAKRIELKDGQNSFSIEFSSLNFQENLSNRYTYILENYDDGWNPATQYNVATYKNIPAGKYLFKVKNINNPYDSDQVTQLEIVVVPPFWLSKKAMLLYVILLVVLFYFALRLIVKMNKLHNDVIIEKQLTDYRLRFFTNISHEFRTPLTIIQGTIEHMNAQKLPVSLKKQVKVLDKSASKLLRLIDQLLEFRKLQNDKMDLRLEQTEVVGFLRDIFELFQETAKKKHIRLSFASNREESQILIDRGKADKILFNFLSNAIKHTPENGEIAVELIFDEDEERFTLKVSDSGIGISPDKRDQLFVRFKQINYTSTGIGIGLNLSYELALSHKGEIRYEQSELGGACFVFSIPTSEYAYSVEDLVRKEESTISDKPKESFLEEEEFLEEELPDENQTTKKYRILLIEDDEEIRHFLKDQLGRYFTVTTAPDGLKGWELASSGDYNLIVCDVMMPGMDGFEVTRKLKSDIQTSHIPIILLTAHSSIEHQLEGINVGADSYITKPFSTRYLVSRIIKLIEQREKLQYKFAHEPGDLQTTISTSAKDSAFIETIQSIVEKHLNNPDFSIDDFAREANMGRTLFYKKIKGITNLSPNEYLRVVRIKKAAELLQTTDLNISEIAYEVGFNNPDYFCKCFKTQFQMKPTQFRQNKKQ